MVKKVLPPLNDQNQVPNIAGSGEWKAEDATFLEKLANGLKMSGEDVVSAADINSVPDVWARVLIVRNGLLDNSKSIVDEFYVAKVIYNEKEEPTVPKPGKYIMNYESDDMKTILFDLENFFKNNETLYKIFDVDPMLFFNPSGKKEK